jgi:hypothetical protein
MHKDKTRRGRHGFVRRIGLALGVVLGLGVGALVYKTYDPSPVGHFRTKEGRRAYAASYAAAMAQFRRQAFLPSASGNAPARRQLKAAS